MVAKKKQQQQQEQSIDDTSIPKAVRVILVMCPKQEMRPVRLSAWVEKVVTESRRSGISDKKIVYLIVKYATANNWFPPQINAVLVDWGLKASGGGGGGESRPFEIEDIQKLMKSLTGLDESGLLRADSRDELERKSRQHILEAQIRLSEFDINHWIAQFNKLATVIDIYSDSLRSRKMELKRSVITE